MLQGYWVSSWRGKAICRSWSINQPTPPPSHSAWPTAWHVCVAQAHSAIEFVDFMRGIFGDQPFSCVLHLVLRKPWCTQSPLVAVYMWLVLVLDLTRVRLRPERPQVTQEMMMSERNHVSNLMRGSDFQMIDLPKTETKAPMMACKMLPMPLTMAIRQAPMDWKMLRICLEYG